MVDVIEPTEAMVDAAFDAHQGIDGLTSTNWGAITETLRAALNHPDARGLLSREVAHEARIEWLEEAAQQCERIGNKEIMRTGNDACRSDFYAGCEQSAEAIRQLMPSDVGPSATPVPAGPTVSVRVPVIVAGTGQWAAWANHQDTDDKDGVAADALDAVTQDPGNVQRYYLTATLPLPQPVDIAAGVEAAGNG